MQEKLNVGRVISRVFQLYGQQFALLVPAALIVFLPVAIVDAAITDAQGFSVGAILLIAISGAVALVGTFWYQGVVVESVRDSLDGVRDFSLGQLFRSVTPVIGALILAGILAGIAIAFGFVLLVVPGLLLLTWWALLAPVIVIERAGVGAAFGRSRSLVRGNGWAVFAVLVLLIIVGAVVSAIFGVLTVVLGDNPVVDAVVTLVAQALTAPLDALAASIMYFELKRIRGRGRPGGRDLA